MELTIRMAWCCAVGETFEGQVMLNSLYERYNVQSQSETYLLLQKIC